MAKHLALVALAIILGLVNWSIAAKERHLAQGQSVYLRLAPVDPRSLMQGDYVILRFEVADRVYAALPKTQSEGGWRQQVAAADGHVVVSLDEQGVGHFVRLDQGEPLQPDEVRMRYRVRSGEVKFASNAFFFEEGRGDEYAGARYGEVRVDRNGDLLVTALHDGAISRLGQTAR